MTMSLHLSAGFRWNAANPSVGARHALARTAGSLGHLDTLGALHGPPARRLAEDAQILRLVADGASVLDLSAQAIGPAGAFETIGQRFARPQKAAALLLSTPFEW
jgi:hypothetical protein